MADNWKYYRTKNGETWDLIAFTLFGNSLLINELIRWNEKYSDLIIFPAGLNLKYKDISITSKNIPPWRR